MERTIRLYAYYRAQLDEAAELRHSDFFAELANARAPIGLANMRRAPKFPGFGRELAASYSIEYEVRNLKGGGVYKYRHPTVLNADVAACDDNFQMEFPIDSIEIDFADILLSTFIDVVTAFNAYRAKSFYSFYDLDFQGGLTKNNHTYNELAYNPEIDINGRNNIFTLGHVNFWDAELCQRALGYGRDEVISRLDGQVPLVRPLMDGVYVVLSTDRHMTYDDFKAMNDRYKPILGLI